MAAAPEHTSPTPKNRKPPRRRTATGGRIELLPDSGGRCYRTGRLIRPSRAISKTRDDDMLTAEPKAISAAKDTWGLR